MTDGARGEIDRLAGARGLSPDEAALRLATWGRNELARGRGQPAWRMIAGQFASPVIWLLIAGAAIAGALGELEDADRRWTATPFDVLECPHEFFSDVLVDRPSACSSP